MDANVSGNQRCWILLELDFQAVVSHPMWMLGMELEFSARALCALNHWTISTSQIFFIVIYLFIGSGETDVHSTSVVSVPFYHVAFRCGTGGQAWSSVFYLLSLPSAFLHILFRDRVSHWTCAAPDFIHSARDWTQVLMVYVTSTLLTEPAL